MSFFNDNKNFIYIKLGHEMKGLTSEAKSEKFKSLKNEVNTRLKKSYKNLHSIEDKIDFYNEAISWLGEYHSDYLLINLFFEKEFPIIYGRVKLPNYIYAGYSIESQLASLLRDVSTDYDIREVIQHNISKEFDLNPNDWHNHERHNNPIVTKLANKMAESCENYQVFLSKTLWFEKSWQLTFENRTPAMKATIFLAKLIGKLESNIDYKMTFAKYYLRYAKVRNNLFIKKVKLPIFYNYEDLVILDFKGVTVQKSKFDSLISDYVFIEELEQLGYYELLKRIEGRNQIVRDKVFELVNKKLNACKLPTTDEVVKINSLNNIDEINSLKTLLFRRTYLFELT